MPDPDTQARPITGSNVDNLPYIYLSVYLSYLHISQCKASKGRGEWRKKGQKEQKEKGGTFQKLVFEPYQQKVK